MATHHGHAPKPNFTSTGLPITAPKSTLDTMIPSQAGSLRMSFPYASITHDHRRRSPDDLRTVEEPTALLMNPDPARLPKPTTPWREPLQFTTRTADACPLQALHCGPGSVGAPRSAPHQAMRRPPGHWGWSKTSVCLVTDPAQVGLGTRNPETGNVPICPSMSRNVHLERVPTRLL